MNNYQTAPARYVIGQFIGFTLVMVTWGGLMFFAADLLAQGGAQ